MDAFLEGLLLDLVAFLLGKSFWSRLVLCSRHLVSWETFVDVIYYV